MMLVGRIAFDCYLPAMPVIEHQLLTDSHHLQLTITFFSIGFGLSQLIYGPLSDRFGRRPILLLGLLLFIIGSALAAYAESITALINARLLSGIGAGVGPVIARAAARDLYNGKKLARIAALQTLVITFALALAPLLGSALLHYFSWRADFFFLVTLGVANLLVFFLVLRETNTQKTTINCAKILRLYGHLLWHRQFIASALIASFAFSGMVIYFQLSPFIFQGQYGLSPMTYSLLTLVVCAAYLLGTLSMSLQLKHRSLNRIMTHGILAMGVGGALLICFFTSHHSSLLSTLTASAIYVYGTRLIVPTATAQCLSPFKRHAGIAAALLGTLTMGIAGAISLLCTYPTEAPLLILGVALSAMACLALACYPLLIRSTAKA
jgi:DHA1 family bicyclomycin/chloramphenicol resistance-like MFS transporter